MSKRYIESIIDEMVFIFGMEREEVEDEFHKNGILKRESKEIGIKVDSSKWFDWKENEKC